MVRMASLFFAPSLTDRSSGGGFNPASIAVSNDQTVIQLKEKKP